MKIEYRNGVKRIGIGPGEYVACRELSVISTLLGSCVAACLFDPVRKVIGMNHFLLATRRYTRAASVIESEAGRYGIHAMELLINRMLKLGATRENLRAKVFGGGNVLRFLSGERNDFYQVGDMNVSFVREFLRNEGIPILASDLAGDCGRIVHFRSDNYAVHVRTISQELDAKVVNSEYVYWERSIRQHDKQKALVHYW